MSYALQYDSFYKDKIGFFEKAAAKASKGKDLIAFADKSVGKAKYPFIARNYTLLQQEFEQLFASLKARKKNRKDLWLYCYYCAMLLATYHEHYGQKAKAQEYKATAEKIKAICASNREVKERKEKREEESFLTHLGKEIGKDIVAFAKTPTQVSKLRDKVGFYNIVRIYWVFCRLTFTNSLRLLRDVKILDMLEKAIGKNIDVDALIETLEAPNSVFRGLSVGFFVARFILNAIMTIKHAKGASKEEKELPFKERFYLEIYKRHPVFLNDVVWAVVNGVTNYAQVFHISAAAAGWITAGFMVFDFALILWRRHLAEEEYRTKKAQYYAELEYCTQHNDLDRHALVVKQMQNLEINWQAKNSTFLFNASAALMLGIGFSASMLFASPVLIILSYAVCMIAVAMYLSDGAYNNYKEKSLRLQEAHLELREGQQIDPRLLKEYQTARNEFIFTMIKNVVMPSLILTLFAVCWQAAVVLIAVYAAYELWNAYSKKKAPADEPDLLTAEPMVKEIEGNPSANDEAMVIAEGEMDQNSTLNYFSC